MPACQAGDRGFKSRQPRIKIMKKFFLLLVSFLFVASCIVRFPTFAVAPLTETILEGEGDDKILVVEISGVLLWSERKGSGGFSLTPEPNIVSRIKEELTMAEKDKNIKALILKIQSPGGLVSASEAIFNEIKNYKEKTGNPVVAYISDVGASGAYYIAVAADKIVANPGAIVGSIGVIAMKVNIKGLMEKLGVENETQKAGEKKDMFSFLRPLSEEEKKIFQDILQEYHSVFKNRVFDGRKRNGNGISVDRLNEIADGRVFSPKQAQSENLIDEIGNIEQAIEIAKKLSKIDKVKIVMYHRPNSYVSNVYSSSAVSDNIIEEFIKNPGVKFLYLWIY